MRNNEIVLLDLFSGIGGFPAGLERAGYKIKKHFFSEIDKHAIANYRYNFKNAEYVGSVTDVRGSDLPERPNVITFGSPCQDFSLAGKRKGMDGERSSLILDAIRLITECKPDVFIWENVKGTFSSNDGADFQAIIQAFANIGGYRLEWQLLNTAWLLPQNRERIYLIGHLGEGSGRFVFPIGEDSIGVNEGATKPANVRTLSAGGNSGGMHSSMTLIKQVAAINSSQDGKVFSPDGHSQTLSAGHGNVPKILVKSATNSGYETATEGDSINLAQPNSETRRGRVGKGKAQTLETSCNQAVIHNTNMSGQTFENDHAGTLRGSASANYQLDSKIRRLTETECERLQGFDKSFIDGSEPANWTKYGIYDQAKPDEVKEISRTQRYKMCGNAVTVDVVEMIGKRLIDCYSK